MDRDEFADAVREDNRTALSRLGSSKALYADTAGEMDDGSVLGAAADRAHAAAETFESWAGGEDHDAASDLFASVAAGERDHYETIADERGDHEPGDPPAVVEHLASVDGTVERVGALVGWALAASNSTDQLVGYFVGQADPQTSGTFREISDGQEGYVADATATLAEVCEDEDDWEAALAAAGRTVQADYEAYFETLESLGVNPKPVC
jgi:hypothetical protein